MTRGDAARCRHDRREVFDALRSIVHAGAPWRLLPTNFPPWPVVYRQTRRWLEAGCFEVMVHDLREMLRWAAGRRARPSAAIFDGATRRSTPESGHRAGYDGYKRRRGSKIHLAVDALGEPLALPVTPANAQDREQVEALAAAVQEATRQSVEPAHVDQGYTGDGPAAGAAKRGIRLEVVKLPAAKRGFVLLPRRRVVGRSFAWAALPAAGHRRRTLAGGRGGAAFPRLRHPDAAPVGHRRRAKSITGSRRSSNRDVLRPDAAR